MYGLFDRHRGNEDHSRKDGLPTIAVVEGPEFIASTAPVIRSWIFRPWSVVAGGYSDRIYRKRTTGSGEPAGAVRHRPQLSEGPEASAMSRIHPDQRRGVRGAVCLCQRPRQRSTGQAPPPPPEWKRRDYIREILPRDDPHRKEVWTRGPESPETFQRFDDGACEKRNAAVFGMEIRTLTFKC